MCNQSGEAPTVPPKRTSLSSGHPAAPGGDVAAASTLDPAVPLDPATKFAEIETRLAKVEKEPKDFWDKLAAISGLASGVAVALIGFYATYIYDDRARAAERAERARANSASELQALEKFLSHFKPEGIERRIAIELVSGIAEGQMAARVARVYGGPESRAAVIGIAVSVPADKRISELDLALRELYRKFTRGVYRVISGPNKTCTAIAVSDGRLLAPSHCIPNAGDKEGIGCVSPDFTKPSVRISRSDMSREYPASIITNDVNFDIAILSVDTPERLFPIEFDDTNDPTGNIVAIGFDAAERNLKAIPGRIVDYSSDRLTIDRPVPSGLLGSPVLDEHGKAIGVLTGHAGQTTGGIPIAIARRLMQACPGATTTDRKP